MSNHTFVLSKQNSDLARRMSFQKKKIICILAGVKANMSEAIFSDFRNTYFWL